MAVYQIFASADASIYYRYPAKNTGRDPILEVSAKNSQDGTRFLFRTPLTENPYYTYDLAAAGNFSTSNQYFSGSDIRRSLLQFSNTDIEKLKTFALSAISASWQANLRLYLASAQNLNTTYSLEAYPVSQSWTMGTGQFAQVPESQNGVSWTYTGPYQNSNPWTITGSSYISSSAVSASQYFDYMSNKDINMNITNMVDRWFSASLSNYGVVVKHPDSVENSTASYVDLKFFSVDTHTIYPPNIEFKWADAVYGPTGSYGLATDDQITIVLQNNQGQFRRNQIYKVRTGVRATYPVRQFTTSSVYLNQLYLPKTSYWSLMDYKTDEVIIDFDTNYTKLSADTESNYFTLYTSGLEVNRFYKLLIKSVLSSGEEVIFTNENLIFKVVE